MRDLGCEKNSLRVSEWFLLVTNLNFFLLSLRVLNEQCTKSTCPFHILLCEAERKGPCVQA